MRCACWQLQFPQQQQLINSVLPEVLAMQQDLATSDFTAQSDSTTTSSVRSNLRIDVPLAYLRRLVK